MKNERRERESLLDDFKKLGFKNMRLKDELKERKGKVILLVVLNCCIFGSEAIFGTSAKRLSDFA